ncbi:MAG: hypothetical protein ACPGGE_06610, partial [Poseidonia sp.]
MEHCSYKYTLRALFTPKIQRLPRPPPGGFKSFPRPRGDVRMTMTITHLGTGSRGNSTLLETPHAKVLIDQGFSGTQLAKRL